MEAINFTHEEMVPNFNLTGRAAIFEGPLPSSPIDTVDPADGTRTVRCGQDWWVLVEWTAGGWLNHIMDGTWEVQVFLEQMGIGEFDVMPSPRSVPFVSTDPHNYRIDIPFVAQSLSVPPGLYKIAVALTMRGPLGVPAPIAAVAEGPVIQFYEVGP